MDGTLKGNIHQKKKKKEEGKKKSRFKLILFKGQAEKEPLRSMR